MINKQFYAWKKWFLLLIFFISPLLFAEQAKVNVNNNSFVPNAPKLSAKAYILVDYNSGRILAEKNATTRFAPASLTKIMTAYLVSKSLTNGTITFNQKTQVSTKAWKMPGSRMFIEQGKWVSVDDLLHGLIIQSGNDATVALAELIGGSESSMVDMMNQQAKILKLKNTHFANSTGLPHSNHYSTATDLALLTKHVIHDYPKEYGLYDKKWFSFNKIKQANRNQLLWKDNYVDGVKTGMTDKAGYCLIASAKRDNMRLIAVVLGAKSSNDRASQAAKLLNYGFNTFKTKLISKRNVELTKIRIWMGTKKLLSLGLNKDWYVTLPKAQLNNLETALIINKSPMAPIDQNTAMGQLQLKINDQFLASHPLISLETIKNTNLLGKSIDYIHYKFNKTISFIKKKF